MDGFMWFPSGFHPWLGLDLKLPPSSQKNGAEVQSPENRSVSNQNPQMDVDLNPTPHPDSRGEMELGF